MTEPRIPGISNLGKPAKQRKGFAIMHPDRQKEIASLGGQAAHLNGRAHEFTPAEARAAGKLSWANRKVKLTTEANTLAKKVKP